MELQSMNKGRAEQRENEATEKWGSEWMMQGMKWKLKAESLFNEGREQGTKQRREERRKEGSFKQWSNEGLKKLSN